MKFYRYLSVLAVISANLAANAQSTYFPPDRLDMQDVNTIFEHCQNMSKKGDASKTLYACGMAVKLGRALGEAPRERPLPTDATRMISWNLASQASVIKGMVVLQRDQKLTPQACAYFNQARNLTAQARAVSSSAPGLSPEIGNVLLKCRDVK